MNRTDRLYALVEQLCVIAPRPRSGRWLADRFEVSLRTIERDINALQQAGTPVWTEPGRTGGYCLDPSRTLPPINFTAPEAVAMAVALENMAGSPFQQAAQTALRKLLAAMQTGDAAAARELAARVHLLGPATARPPVPALVADALSARRVLRIAYQDRDGARTTREIEPLPYVGTPTHWFLVGWCRGGLGKKRNTMNLVSIRIITDNVATLASFYEQLTGGNEHFAEVRTSSTTLAIGSTATVALFGPGFARAADNHSAILEFLVDDVDLEYRKLLGWATTIVNEPTTLPWGNRSLLLRDPDGNHINLFTPVTTEAVEKFASFPK